MKHFTGFEFGEKKGGRGTCRYCNEQVNNCALHETLCEENPKLKSKREALEIKRQVEEDNGMAYRKRLEELLSSPIALNWEGKPKNNWRVVAAAQRHRVSGLIVTGARHFDKIMRAQMFALAGNDHEVSANFEVNQDLLSWDKSWNGSEGGFIDNYGDFLTRKEAWIVAEEAGQIGIGKHGQNGNGTLYSENIH